MTALTLDRSFFIKMIDNMYNLIEEKKDYLTQLDSEIGDGDHGINLSIGFREVKNQLNTINETTSDIASLFKKIGMILLGKVGGSSGPLYGSFFIKAGANIKGKNEVSFVEFCEMIELGVNAIENRGKASIGDKTMVDAFVPGINTLKEHLKTETDEIKIFQSFIDSMKEGAESTVPLIAKKGRAMRLGERAVGHKDPGAESACLLMEVFLNGIKELSNSTSVIH
ncbi:dihydroxyacetone kinase subunit L [Bacillaceae bacterium Marseille-Q3522]|nr:dihydroxyacetone kinase subunit L [Bacillaceae bacterium Marseille-Q3522]